MTTFIARTGLALSLLLSACTRLESEVVNFQGREIEIVDAGDGPTTVVFEAGLGDDWHHWNRVASDVSEDTRVFAYSRPGYGDSDDATTPRDPGHIVEELRELLASQDIPPPYVLVGHSFGGTYMELFARAHPDEVAGLVLVDSRPSDFLAECESAGLDECGVPPAQVEATGGVFAAEYNAFTRASEEMMAAGTFGAYPVRVLTATRRAGKSPERAALWTSMHTSLAEEAADGSQIRVHGGHYLQVFHARKVAEVIRGVLP
jgi:pimeloyl-ACP methyl ester carboxylesterase